MDKNGYAFNGTCTNRSYLQRLQQSSQWEWSWPTASESVNNNHDSLHGGYAGESYGDVPAMVMSTSVVPAQLNADTCKANITQTPSQPSALPDGPLPQAKVSWPQPSTTFNPIDSIIPVNSDYANLNRCSALYSDQRIPPAPPSSPLISHQTYPSPSHWFKGSGYLYTSHAQPHAIPFPPFSLTSPSQPSGNPPLPPPPPPPPAPPTHSRYRVYQWGQ